MFLHWAALICIFIQRHTQNIQLWCITICLENLVAFFCVHPFRKHSKEVCSHLFVETLQFAPMAMFFYAWDQDAIMWDFVVYQNINVPSVWAKLWVNIPLSVISAQLLILSNTIYDLIRWLWVMLQPLISQTTIYMINLWFWKGNCHYHKWRLIVVNAFRAKTKWLSFSRRHFPCIFLIEKFYILIQISLKFVSKDPIEKKAFKLFIKHGQYIALLLYPPYPKDRGMLWFYVEAARRPQWC